MRQGFPEGCRQLPRMRHGGQALPVGQENGANMGCLLLLLVLLALWLVLSALFLVSGFLFR
jgi:hypothetical protein